jgi:hypothetical protein
MLFVAALRLNTWADRTLLLSRGRAHPSPQPSAPLCAPQKELVASPSLEEIVHYDAWARRWVAEKVASGSFSSKVFAMA